MRLMRAWLYSWVRWAFNPEPSVGDVWKHDTLGLVEITGVLHWAEYRCPICGARGDLFAGHVHIDRHPRYIPTRIFRRIAEPYRPRNLSEVVTPKKD